MAKFTDLIFHTLDNVDDVDLPQLFTYPFYYEPHELCRRASKEIQNYLNEQTDFKHNFGLDSSKSGLVIGKMFGVMIVQGDSQRLGYICAFSGKLAESNDLGGFVPPIYDTLNPKGFYKQGEATLNEMNTLIEEYDQAEDLQHARDRLEACKLKFKKKLAQLKLDLKARKAERKLRRQEAAQTLDSDALEKFNERLDQESIRSHFELRDLKNYWIKRIEEAENELTLKEAPLARLKAERKLKSNSLQKQLHQQYRFLNAKGVSKDLVDIFNQTVLNTPPAGAGECAAPKLFQYAYTHRLKPIAMAEFWWGASPKSEIRQHKQFYPSCKSKCEPILSHMMHGLKVEPNPIITPIRDVDLHIVYEDDNLLLVNKPHEFLSVPGRNIKLSVQSKMKAYLPNSSGPLLLHRLDMSTSGLLLVAKDERTHFHLQQQFIKRQIKKKYVAILDGVISADQGLIDLPLALDYENRPRQMVSFDNGKQAQTHFEKVSEEYGKTRVHFYPISGRTHQLRVHAAHHLGLNCPILGDDLYGNKSDRLYLHAEELSFMHPHTKEPLTICCSAPF